MADWDHPGRFELRLTPQAADIDGLNHVNNAVYVGWCQDVAWAHSEALGLSLADYQRLDAAMAIRAAAYDYLRPALRGEPLVLGTWLAAGDGRLSMERRFQLRRAADGATLLRARWQLVCIAIASGRPRRMPAEFVSAYQAAVVAG
ncbi:MAG: acyl-CoA thioesterase [Pelomonas sp.]|nr:acyl-CoA thioesterase [Roseateles sp.]